MKICYGDDRMVVLIGPLALKFINPKIFKFPKELRWVQFSRAMIANITEWLTYQGCHSGYLAPTYVSFGFINIARREFGQEVSQEEIDQLFSCFSKELEEAFKETLAHSVRSPRNWLRTDRGLILLDYGDVYSKPAPSLSWILWNVNYSKELASHLLKS